jgi:hypothetical protein
LENSVWPIPTIAVRLRQRGSVDLGEEQLDRRTESDIAVDVLQVRDHAHAVIQVDQGDEARMLVRPGRVLGDDPGADGAAAARFVGFPFQRLAMRAHRTRRLANGAAVQAFLEQQLPRLDPFPEEILIAHGSPSL